MTTFDEREEAFEKKFAIEEELKFKAEARRNRLLGLWAAEQLGLSGPAADSYAHDVVRSSFDAPAGGVTRKILADFAAGNVAVPEATIADKLNELLAQALAQLKAGK